MESKNVQFNVVLEYSIYQLYFISTSYNPPHSYRGKIGSLDF